MTFLILNFMSIRNIRKLYICRNKTYDKNSTKDKKKMEVCSCNVILYMKIDCDKLKMYITKLRMYKCRELFSISHNNL